MQASSLSIIKKSEVLKDERSLPASQTKNHFPSRDIASSILLILGFVGLGFHSVAFLLQPPKHAPPFPVWVPGHTQVIRPGSECFNTEPSPQPPAAVFSTVLTPSNKCSAAQIPPQGSPEQASGLCAPLLRTSPNITINSIQ